MSPGGPKVELLAVEVDLKCVEHFYQVALYLNYRVYNLTYSKLLSIRVLLDFLMTSILSRLVMASTFLSLLLLLLMGNNPLSC